MPGPFYFAWCGGTVQEQVTVVTTGRTHGGVIETTAIVGDIAAGDVQIRQVASNVGLAPEFYGVEGPGIADGTGFVNEPNVAGPADAINLDAAVTATLKSATFKVIKSIEVETTVATFSAGSNVVAISGSELLPGTYGVTGQVIGQYSPPAGGADVVIGQAMLSHDGAGTGYMSLLVSVADVGDDGTTTYTVEQVDVKATATGDFPLRVTGMPDGDWYTITSIPSEHLATLTAGLRYNIAGNGIQIGTTFLAPGPGSTSIELDLPASSTGLAILTIAGPRTPDADFDPSIHNRFDEDIVSVEIAQDEGGFATLSVQVKNPAVGLLAPGRNLWCWLSWDQSWPDGTPDLLPLFNGRLVGVPRLQAGELVQLEFIARPDDFNAQKVGLSDSLSVLPYWDPIWLAQNVNPDTVLETYSALWHIDRTSLDLTVSDIIQGEDGIVSIGEGQAFYDHFSLAYDQPPLNSVTVSGTVTWQQQAEGLLDVTGPIVRAFYDAGSPWPGPLPRPAPPPQAPLSSGFARVAPGGAWAGQGLFGETPYARPVGPAGGGIPPGGGALIAAVLEGLRNDWPKPGTNIGGGWNLSTQNDDNGTPLCFCHDASWLKATSMTLSWSTPQFQTQFEGVKGTLGTLTQAYQKQQLQQVTASYPIVPIKVRMVLDYKADRKRNETVTAVLVGNVQPELSDSSESDREEINLTSQYVAQGVDPGGDIPIGNLGYKSYFQTDRGGRSFEYLLLAARAKVRARARAVDITFGVDWQTALGINLRNSVTYYDRRLPGGVATGKVKSYKLTAGATMVGEFTIGCTIGTGEASTAAIGVNSYVEDAYVEIPYQVIAGGQIELMPAEIAYQSLDDFSIVDDGLNLTGLTTENAVNFVKVINGINDQVAAVAPINNTVSSTNPSEVLKQMTTTVTLDMRPLQGAEFNTRFFPAVTQLALPKTIDLAATTG
jgi:hypothetical protein